MTKIAHHAPVHHAAAPAHHTPHKAQAHHAAPKAHHATPKSPKPAPHAAPNAAKPRVLPSHLKGPAPHLLSKSPAAHAKAGVSTLPNPVGNHSNLSTLPNPVGSHSSVSTLPNFVPNIESILIKNALNHNGISHTANGAASKQHGQPAAIQKSAKSANGPATNTLEKDAVRFIGGAARGFGIKAIGRSSLFISSALGAIDVGKSIAEHGFDKHTRSTAARATGGVVGAFVGAKLGASAGAALGTAIAPGVGTAVGAVLGGVGGAIVGGHVGAALVQGGEHVAESIAHGIGDKLSDAEDFVSDLF